MKFTGTMRFFSIISLAGLLLLEAISQASAADKGPGLTPPAQLIADPGNKRVTLSWSPVTNATSYNIYYSSSPGVTRENSTKIEDIHSPFIARDLTNGKACYFAATARHATGESMISGEVSATPSASPPPPAPTSVTAASAGDGQVLVSWAPSSDATSYQIYFSTTPRITKKTGKKLVGVASPQTVYPLTNGVTYYFVVTASNRNGESGTSFETAMKPVAGFFLSSAPTGIFAHEGNGQITIGWTPSPEATSYNIYYSRDLSPTKETGIKISNVTNPAILKGLKNNEALFFVVTADNVNGESLISAQVSATPVNSKPLPALLPIPAGPFQMGDNLDGTAYSQPVHVVYLDGFHIDRYETTFELWKQVHEWALVNGYTFDRPGRNGSHDIGTNMPVTGIGWYDVVKWLNARSEKEARTPVYYTDGSHTTVYRTGQINITDDAVKWTSNGYRLPTEAEWEKAARGGLAGKRYPWGDDLGTGNGNHNMGRTTSVGTYPPNGFDLYDMAGNVFEWVWDWASEAGDYSWAVSPATNPHGISGPPVNMSVATRVRRGGAYTYGFRYMKCYERMFRVPTYASPYFGFRSASKGP